MLMTTSWGRSHANGLADTVAFEAKSSADVRCAEFGIDVPTAINFYRRGRRVAACVADVADASVVFNRLLNISCQAAFVADDALLPCSSDSLLDEGGQAASVALPECNLAQGRRCATARAGPRLRDFRSKPRDGCFQRHWVA